MSCQESSIFSQIDQDLTLQLALLAFWHALEDPVCKSSIFHKAIFRKRPKSFYVLELSKKKSEKGGSTFLLSMKRFATHPFLNAFFRLMKILRIFWECHKIIDIMISIYIFGGIKLYKCCCICNKLGFWVILMLFSHILKKGYEKWLGVMEKLLYWKTISYNARFILLKQVGTQKSSNFQGKTYTDTHKVV